MGVKSADESEANTKLGGPTDNTLAFVFLGVLGAESFF
jgi:hypothetical protein